MERLNLYAYVGNDPTNAIDPSGLALQQVANGSYGLRQSGYRNLRDAYNSGGRKALLDPVGTAFQLLSSYPIVSGTGPLSEVASMVGEGAIDEVGLSGTALARSLAQAGEDAVGITGPKVSIRVPGSGQIRIPDALTETTLTEVKNVGSLSYTQQQQDFAKCAEANGLQFQLFVRPSIHLTRPLQEAIANGQIVPRFIPGAP